jgi:hypothetical protein
MKRSTLLIAFRRVGLLATISTALAGCTTPGISKIDPIHAPPETATLDYWLSQPASATVHGKDYEVLWQTCERVADDRDFALERRDYRNGILTTRPVLGAQLLEIWRRDIVDPYSVAESNLASVRRTIQFEFITTGSDVEVSPRVVVERKAMVERRVTLGLLNRNAFSGSTVEGYNDYDQPIRAEREYWYATRRDENFEKILANEIQQKLPRERSK